MNRKDEVGLDIRFSGVRGYLYAHENWEEVVVVEEHGILIGCYRAFSLIQIETAVGNHLFHCNVYVLYKRIATSWT